MLSITHRSNYFELAQPKLSSPWVRFLVEIWIIDGIINAIKICKKVTLFYYEVKLESATTIVPFMHFLLLSFNRIFKRFSHGFFQIQCLKMWEKQVKSIDYWLVNRILLSFSTKTRYKYDVDGFCLPTNCCNNMVCLIEGGRFYTLFYLSSSVRICHILVGNFCLGSLERSQLQEKYFLIS